MVKRVLIGIAALVVLLMAGAFVAVRMLLDPESVRATIESQASAALAEPVTVGAASVSLWPRAGIVVTGMAIGSPASVHLERAQASTALGALLSRRIEDADIVVENSTLDLAHMLAMLDRLAGDPPDAPSGMAAGEPVVSLISVRSIALQNVTIRAGDRQAVFDLESSLDGDRLELTKASVISDVSNLTASGVIDSLTARKASLKLAADTLDLDGLMVFAHAFANAVPTPAGNPTRSAAALPASPMDVRLAITAEKGHAGGAPFEKLATSAHLTAAGMTFDPFGLAMFGGRVEGVVHVDTQSAEPAWSIKGRTSGLDMVRLTEFAGSAGSMTGMLGGSFALSGSGADSQRAMNRARGQGTMAITDGKMNGLELVRTIVLAFGKPNMATPEGSGEAFSRLGANFSIASGVVTLSDLAFVSRDVDVAGAGTLALGGSRLDVRGKAMLSKELTDQAGRDLVRYTAENGRVTVPATVSGTVSAPKVGVDMAGLAGRAVTNELKRQTESAIDRLLKRKKP